jgi:hypothetical protein
MPGAGSPSPATWSRRIPGSGPSPEAGTSVPRKNRRSPESGSSRNSFPASGRSGSLPWSGSTPGFWRSRASGDSGSLLAWSGGPPAFRRFLAQGGSGSPPSSGTGRPSASPLSSGPPGAWMPGRGSVARASPSPRGRRPGWPGEPVWSAFCALKLLSLSFIMKIGILAPCSGRGSLGARPADRSGRGRGGARGLEKASGGAGGAPPPAIVADLGPSRPVWARNGRGGCGEACAVGSEVSRGSGRSLPGPWLEAGPRSVRVAGSWRLGPRKPAGVRKA